MRAPTPGPRRTVFWHQKGRTGKTTLAIACAVRLAMDGQRAPLIDTDPQGTATAWGERFAARWGLVVRGRGLAPSRRPHARPRPPGARLSPDHYDRDHGRPHLRVDCDVRG